MSGGGKGAKTAKAPDYAALATQQGEINQNAANAQTAANRPTQINAQGNSLQWYQGPDGNWTQQVVLTPENKAAQDTSVWKTNANNDDYSTLLHNYLSSYHAPAQSTDPQFSGKAVSDALYGSVMDRGRVEQQRENDALTSQLRNSGLQPGSEAYDRAMKNLMTSQNDANLLAGQNATLAGANESRAQYNTYLQGRNQPLQELTGMSGMAGQAPATSTPVFQGFSGATGYNPTDLVGAAQAQYGAKQQGANAQNSKKSGLMGAGASLGGSYLGSK